MSDEDDDMNFVPVTGDSVDRMLGYSFGWMTHDHKKQCKGHDCITLVSGHAVYCVPCIEKFRKPCRECFEMVYGYMEVGDSQICWSCIAKSLPPDPNAESYALAAD